MRVLLGVCGGIASYKAAELLRLLQQQGVDVEVAMTASAERFVTPLTFATLSGHPVFTSLWNAAGNNASGEPETFGIEHVDVAQRIDALVIAPATANTLAKLAHGIADDFLTTTALATRSPIVVAPAMNVNMWQHPATQANVALLEQRGVRFVAPDAGYLACGMTGSGRLAAVETIATEVMAVLHPVHDLEGEHILITAGGTKEPIDPVRFLGNRSSGKMGYALAEEAVARGANVTLVTASSLPVPTGCTVFPVTTAAEMAEAVFSALPFATIVIKTAAVSDFRVRTPSASKLRRTGSLTLDLEPTEDIAAGIVQQRTPGTLVVAFAAETENIEVNASEKLRRKGVDAVIANDVSQPGIGFESDRNAGLFLTAERTVPLPESSKRHMARQIMSEVAHLRKNATHLISPGEPTGAFHR